MDERPGPDTFMNCGGWAEKPVPKPVELTEMKPTGEGLLALREILLALRWDDSGGYPSYRGEGKWVFVTGGLGNATPEQWNLLMEMAGIVPDKIEQIGPCKTCAFSVNGRDRGWGAPCVACKQPYHDFYLEIEVSDGKNE